MMTDTTLPIKFLQSCIKVKKAVTLNLSRTKAGLVPTAKDAARIQKKIKQATCLNAISGLFLITVLYGFISSSKLKIARKYLDIDKFKQFRIEDGTLAWSDNEFDLNPLNIYEGKYDAS